MTTLLAFALLLLLLAGIGVLLERTHRRAAGTPRPPWGADAAGDLDLGRLLHDLDVTRSAR